LCFRRINGGINILKNIGVRKEYINDVKTGRFPTADHVYHIKDSIEDFEKLFAEFE
jgi:hypothetical protein